MTRKPAGRKPGTRDICKPQFPGPVFCAAMDEALNTETLTGLSTETLYRLNDPRGPQPRIAMVAVRRKSHEKPRWLHFCPWCLAPLVPLRGEVATVAQSKLAELRRSLAGSAEGRKRT